MPIRASKPQWQHDALAAVVMLCMGALLLWRQGDIGPTVDEPFHLIRGLSWWWTGTARLSYAHPPLANVIMAAPAAAFFPPLDITATAGWESADHAEIAYELVGKDYAALRPMLFVARLGSSVIGVVLAGAVYLWTSRRVGAWIGLVALVMVAFNPTILAHAQLVTTDIPVALTVFVAVATFIDYIHPRAEVADVRWRRWFSLVAFAVAVGAALITKFTALTYIPFFGVIGLVWAWRGRGRFTGPSRGRRIASVALDIGIVAVICLFMVGAIYRFEDMFWTIDQVRAAPEPRCYLTEDWAGGFLENRSIIGFLPGWLVMPVPYTWLFGLEMVRAQGHMLHATWFLGFASEYGNPAYFPSLFLLKTPKVVVLGLVLGAARLGLARRWPTTDSALILGAAAMLLALLMTSMLNIGFRHALPIVPLLTVLSAKGLVATAHDVAAWGGSPRRHLVVTGVVVLLLSSAVVTSVANAGRYLSYFNVGRDLGERVSIVGDDWGQDTIRLAKVVKERDLMPLRYHSYGIASVYELRYQGVDMVYAQHCARRVVRYGWLAVHAANVKRFQDCFREIRTRPPDLIVADHVYMWELTPPKLRDAVKARREKERERKKAREQR